MTDMEKDQHYHVNLQRVVEQSEFLAVTRLLATHIIQNPYMRISDFIRNLSDSDLIVLLDIFEDMIEAEDNEDCENVHAEEFVLIAEMLALAEGLDGPTVEQSMKRTNQLSMFLTLESLRRKGLVKLHYENMSFGEDFENKIIAEKP